jgi:hypothetical protein
MLRCPPMCLCHQAAEGSITSNSRDRQAMTALRTCILSFRLGHSARMIPAANSDKKLVLT